jgi:hypothetical protein
MRAMKLKTRTTFLLLGLIFPYSVFVLYFVLRLPQHPLPGWFLYVCVGYIVGLILVFPSLRKRVISGAPPLGPEAQKAQQISSARALRRLGYVWLLGPFFYYMEGGFSDEPHWVSLLGLLWVGFLIWATFRAARKMELKAGQNTG